MRRRLNSELVLTDCKVSGPRLNGSFSGIGVKFDKNHDYNELCSGAIEAQSLKFRNHERIELKSTFQNLVITES